jgi:hypothetical protein
MALEMLRRPAQMRAGLEHLSACLRCVTLFPPMALRPPGKALPVPQGQGHGFGRFSAMNDPTQYPG